MNLSTSKHFLLLAFLVYSTFQIHAQAAWSFAAPTDGTGSAGAETARSICTDASGNVYIVGVFNGAGVPTDFDLSASFTNLFTATTSDGFIVSYDKNGGFRWKTIVTGAASDFGAPSGGVCTDGTNVWVAGAVNMAGSPIIASSSNTIVISSAGTNVDAFVSKLNCSNGAVQWAQAFGGSASLDFGEGICVDPSGNCYVTGSYSGAFTLNSISAPAPGGTSDFYIAKFNSTGTLIALNTGGSIANTDMIGIGGGLCYVPGGTPALVATGHIGASAANFGAFTGLANSGLNDCFLVELDLSLNFTNALVFGSAAADELPGAVYDSNSGAVFVSGFGGGNLTFPGTAAITGLGAQDIILGRYSVSSNNFVWSNVAGGTGNDRSWCVTTDNLGGIFISGYFASPTCAFGGTVSIGSNAGTSDLYVTRYNTNGTPIWTQFAGSAAVEEARSIASYVQAVPYQQMLFVTGIYQGALTIGSTNLLNDGGNDFYLAKINDNVIACLTPTLNLSGQTNVLCNGGSTGSATVSASGGSPFTYTWSPSGGNAAIATGLSAGNYTCITTNSCGLTATRTVTIAQPASALNTATAITNVACNGGSTGSATVTASGGTTPYTYLWSTAQTTSVITGLNAGVRTVTVTDANGCTSTKSVTITQPATALSTATSVTNVLCFGNSTGSATITASGGTPGYTYLWSTAQTTSVISGLNAGVRTVTVTDANGCTSTRTVTITQPATALSTATTVTNVLCNGGSTGSATVTASGGTGAYTYLWSTAATTSVISGLNASVRTVTVTDANGCTITNAINITQPTALVTTTAVTNILCFGGSNASATITATGGTPGYTYLWSSAQTTSVISGQSAGVKTVTVTDLNGCTSTKSITVTQPGSALNTATAVTNILCFGGSTGSATVTASGGTPGYTYLWSGAQTTSVISAQTFGIKTVTVTDANGCTATTTANITQPGSGVTSATAITNVLCNGNSTGSATITASGGSPGYTYLWSGTQTTSVITGQTTGVKTVTVTDANGCTTTNSVNITQPSALVATPSQTNVTCVIAGAASVLVSGGAGSYSYTWTPSGGNTSLASGLSAGNYTCNITDANACVISQTFAITANTLAPTVSITGTNQICNGQSVLLTASGANNYSWDTGPTTNTIATTPTTNVTYTVIGTALNGCTNTAVQSITVNPSPTLSIANGNICPGDSFTLTPSGASTYTYLNGGPVVSPTITTSYSVVGTSSAGCVSSNTVVSVITVTNNITVSISGATVICNGQVLNLTANGATSYTWNTGATTTTIAPTPSVNTTYSVLGASGFCSNTAIYSIIVNPNPTVTAISSETNVLCLGQSATLTASGANTYSWSSGGILNTEVISPIITTTYTLTGTNANGCSNTTTITQNVSPCTNISNNIHLNDLIKLFPSPTSGILNVEINTFNESTSIEIYNSIGRLLIKEKVISIKHQIDLSSFTNGIYFVKLLDETGFVIKKVIKD